MASMLGGIACGAIVLGLLATLWPSQAAPLPPVLVGLAGVLALAGGAFGSLYALERTRHG
ncbi:hypothetical protein [Methylobacterium sp. Leaf456]|uniref:hypothetical protein n=1 Tax=Methylobacterium sp. Leaf456 TaxID=1736382 RepID=UPI0012E34650|nr:hypothetical protein [Methylobacterium sp. Leaf456]